MRRRRLAVVAKFDDRAAATASFAAGVSLAPPGRYVARYIEVVVIALLLALIALPAPARAQTITISSVTASPASVQPGQSVVFTAKLTASQNLSKLSSPVFIGAPGRPSTKTTQGLFYGNFTAGASLTEAYSWTVPAGTTAGTYKMYVDVFNPAYSVEYAQANTALAITAAGTASAPRDMEPPVVSGTAQVGDALSSTTGTWTAATSYAYQWAGNGTKIAAATAATYTPVSTDAGHTLTSTVTATGSSGATASATSAPTVAIVAANSTSASKAHPMGWRSRRCIPTSCRRPVQRQQQWHVRPRRPGRRRTTRSTAATSSLQQQVHIRTCKVGERSAIARRLRAASTGTAASTSPRCSAAALTVGACYITTKTNTTGNTVAFDVTSSNWAVEGWYVNTGDHGRAFEAYACSYSGGMKHHIAFINDISADNLLAADTNDCGQDEGSTTVPSPVGTDYVAIIGMIAQNSAQDPICLAAIVVTFPEYTDTNAGTHYFVYGNFSYANTECWLPALYQTQKIICSIRFPGTTLSLLGLSPIILGIVLTECAFNCLTTAPGSYCREISKSIIIPAIGTTYINSD